MPPDDVLVADFEDTATGAESPVSGHHVDPVSATALAPRRRDLRRHDLAAVPRRRARQTTHCGRLHAAVRQHPARVHRVRADSTAAATAGLLRRRHRRSPHLGSRAVTGRDSGQHQPADHQRRRISSPAGVSTKAPERWSTTRRQTRSTARSPAARLRVDGGAPFNLAFNQAPSQPVLNTPANGATGQSTSPTLSVNVSDPDGDPLAVTFYGRPCRRVGAGRLHPGGLAGHAALLRRCDARGDLHGADAMDRQQPRRAEHPLRHPPRRHRRAHRRACRWSGRARTRA